MRAWYVKASGLQPAPCARAYQISAAAVSPFLAAASILGFQLCDITYTSSTRNTFRHEIGHKAREMVPSFCAEQHGVESLNVWCDATTKVSKERRCHGESCKHFPVLGVCMFLLVLFDYQSAAMLEKHGGDANGIVIRSWNTPTPPKGAVAAATRNENFKMLIDRRGHNSQPSLRSHPLEKRSTVDSVDTSKGISIPGLLVGQLWTRAGWIPASLYHNSKYLKCTLKCPTLSSWPLCHSFAMSWYFPNGDLGPFSPHDIMNMAIVQHSQQLDFTTKLLPWATEKALSQTCTRRLRLSRPAWPALRQSALHSPLPAM